MNSGFAYREVVDEGAAGFTLEEHLARRYRHTTRDGWRGRIAEGRVLVDGRRAPAGTLLRAGQEVVWNRPPWEEPDAPLGFAVLHRDGDLLAVAKPAGLPTLPGGGFLENTLAALVRRRWPEASPVHRLDRGASGIVLFARTDRARDHLAAAFRAGRVVKEYLALVRGAPAADTFVVDTPIGRIRHERIGLVHAAVQGGGRAARAPRAARSDVEVVERRDGATLVAVRPLTGRPHQIRIHLAAAGLPLVGDPLYGHGGLPVPGALAAGGIGYHLHALRVCLEHPATAVTMEVWCAPPPILRRGRCTVLPALTAERPAAL